MTSEAVTEHVEERAESVGWLELFFDLVVVAAIAVLADGVVEDPTWRNVGMLLLLYAAVWMTWISIALYTNLAAEKTRTRTVIITMFLVAVMAASAPAHHDERANAFAIAFLIARSVVGGSALRTGKILAGWPLLQFGGAASPWLVAMWVPTPAKYWVWALAVVVDIGFVVWRGSADPADVVEAMNARNDARRERTLEHAERERAERERREQARREAGRRVERGPGRERRGRDEDPIELVAVDVNTAHLDERLGVFIIIVLGEAVSQIVIASSDVEWQRRFVVAMIAGFATLAGLWWLTFSYGFASAPHTRLASLAPRFGLPMHLVSTAGIVCLATGLSGLTEAPTEAPADIVRWLMCGGLAVHFFAGGIGGYAAHASWGWILGWALPCTAVPLLLGAFGGELAAYGLAICMLAVVGWQVLYGLKARAVIALPHPEEQRAA